MNEKINLNEFKKFLIEQRKLKTQEAEEAIEIINEFKLFFYQKSLSSLKRKELMKFITYLIKAKRNSEKNIITLLRFGFFINNKEIIITLYELLDAYDVMDNLSNKIKEELGEKDWQEIFKDIVIPKLGETSENRPKITEKILERFEEKAAPDLCKEILASGLHGGDMTPEFKIQAHEKFLKAKDIDDFLIKKHKEYVQYLDDLMKKDELYFTQEITPEVLEYVKNNPIISGIRKGKIIEEIKIPFNTKEYLQATDNTMKRYHYCHCMWVKEAIKNPKIKVSPTFCYCSVGFHRKFWEAAFGQQIKIEVLESAIGGDSVCKFAIYIPNNLLKD